MADRVVRVKLEAITSAYKRGMDEAARATSGVVEKAGGLEKLGGSMSKVGGIMTKSVTAPLVLAGGAAVKMSMDFESSMSKMVGLVGLSKEEVAGFKDGIMDLAGETARAPRELADAMFFITSAGLSGSDAMDVLTASAKAATAGLGDTKTIADLATSAMNAYGAETLSAEQAVDDLTMAVRLGKLEPQELAGAMGRVIPIASAMGVEFHEIAAAMAGMSRTGTNAAEGATQLRGILSGLLSPGKEARDILESLHSDGLAGIQSMLRDDGLLATLEFLVQSLGGNASAAEQVFGNIRALSGVMDMLGSNVEGTREIFDGMTDTVGVTDEAFGVMADTAGFKMQQAFAELQVALVQIGDVLAPMIANVAGFATTIVQAFSSLPGPAQNAVIAFGAILAATGPLLSIGGKILTNWQSLSSGASTLASKLSLVKTAAAGLAGVAVVAAINAWRSEMNKAASDAQAFAETFASKSNFDPAVASMNELHDEILRLGGAMNEMQRQAGDDWWNPFSRFGEARKELEAVIAPLLEIEATAASLQQQLGISSDEALRMATNTEIMTAALDPATGELDANAAATADHAAAAEDAADAQKAFEESIKNVTNAIRSQLDPIWAAQDALLSHKDAQDAVTAAELELIAAQNELNDVTKEHGRKSDQAREASLKLMGAQDKLEGAHRKVVRSALDVQAATTELATRVDAGTVSIEAAEAQLRQWVDQGIITADQAWRTAQELRGTADAAHTLSGIGSIVIGVYADTTHFDTQIARVNRTVVESGDGAVRTTVVSNIARKSGGPIPGGRDQPVPITAHGGEFVLSADVVDAIKHGRPTAGLPALAPSSATFDRSSTRHGDTNVWHITTTDGRIPSQVRQEQRRREMLRAM
jgi:TP901 family phage tail tape measure protein